MFAKFISESEGSSHCAIKSSRKGSITRKAKAESTLCLEEERGSEELVQVRGCVRPGPLATAASFKRRNMPSRKKKVMGEEESSIENNFKMLSTVLVELNNTMKSLQVNLTSEIQQMRIEISNKKEVEKGSEKVDDDNSKNLEQINSEGTSASGKGIADQTEVKTDNVKTVVAQKVDRSYITAWKDLGVVRYIFLLGGLFTLCGI
ncbi:hypothetical protein NQ315_014764 [Exocentrus adspersus]|uniref:Uncharacterized protein n=1 Tax=Exocentrus adspersus TaxID=1586481 RepID=A0AAV8VLR3_9CUCU|nr:hypothetical protein NQ315_014764 [Exocentrus adspersus]